MPKNDPLPDPMKPAPDGPLREFARRMDIDIEVLKRTMAEMRGSRRRPKPDGGEPIPAIPPRGPMPLVGGAEAPLDD
jgi:hypothetical protein